MTLIGPILFLGNRKHMTVKCLSNVLSSYYPLVIRCLAPELKAMSGESNQYQQVPKLPLNVEQQKQVACSYSFANTQLSLRKEQVVK